MYEVAPTAAYIVPAGQPHAGEFVFTDTVTATAWEQHIMTPSETNYIDRKMATATCYAPANASISLTKSCDTAILVDGEKAKVTIFGTGENTGDVALKEVKLFDNTIPSISFEALSACLDANGNEACDEVKRFCAAARLIARMASTPTSRRRRNSPTPAGTTAPRPLPSPRVTTVNMNWPSPTP